MVSRVSHLDAIDNATTASSYCRDLWLCDFSVWVMVDGWSIHPGIRQNGMLATLADLEAS